MQSSLSEISFIFQIIGLTYLALSGSMIFKLQGSFKKYILAWDQIVCL